MRVALVSSCFPPMVGGIERLVQDLAAEIAKRDDLLVVTRQDQRPSAPVLYAHTGLEGLVSCRTVQEAAETGCRLRKRLNEFGPDIVLLCDALPLVHAEAIAGVAPTAAIVHGNDLTSPWALWPEDPRPAIEAGLRSCGMAFVLSGHVGRLVSGVAPHLEVLQIPAGCDRSRFFPDPNAARDLGHRFRLRDGVFTVLTCSRLAPRKGHADLFQALKLSKLRADWIIAGGGSWRNCARLWRDTWSPRPGARLRVRRVGHVDDRTLRGLFHRADVFALTPIERQHGTRLDSEGYGLVYLEANACGCPALATRSGGCADAVLDGVTGFLAEPGDPVSIAETLLRFAASPDAGVTMGAAGQARVDAFDGWRAATATVRDHLAAIVDSPAPRMVSNV